MNSNRPFDLAKLDTEAVRKKKRKQLFLVSLPLVGVTLLAGLWFVAPTLFTNLAIHSYDAHEYDSAHTYLQPLSYANAFERYKLYFNRGTVAAMGKQYDYAVDQFTLALAYVNDDSVECKIRSNLVLTYTKQAESFLQTSAYDKAVTAYTKAIAQVTARPGCFDGQAGKKLGEKRDDAQQLADEQGDKGDSNSDGTPASSNDAGTPSDAQQQKLKQAQSAAAQAVQEDNEIGKSHPLSDYVEKPY